MLRRGICMAALAAPILAFVCAPGCSDEPDIEDICTWLASPNSCYARFADDVGVQCGEAYVPGSDPVADATGSFADRADLSLCVRDAGGQVLFDPPFDMTAFPPPAFSFTMLNERAAVCGLGTYAGAQTFSITIQPVLTGTDAGVPPDPPPDPPVYDILGGTFTSTKGEGNAFDVVCPGGDETHHFSNLVLDKCPDHDGKLPAAVFDYSPGVPETDLSAGVAGYVRLRVVYPPTDPTLPDDPAALRVVQYFDCTIPHPPHHCDDGIKNSGETDVDCGGTCANRRLCDDGMGCGDGGDCLSGVCDYVQGIRQCIGP